MILKKSIIVLFVALFALFSFEVLAEHKPDPLYKSENAELSVWGYTNIAGGPEKDFMASPLRIRTSGKYKNWSFFMENDIAGLDSRVKENYITQAWVGYTIKDPLIGNMFSNTTVRVGSIYTAGSQYLPAPFMTIPSIAQKNPFSYFGYGVQVQTNITKNLVVIGDVTGTTGPAFNDFEKRTSQIETSQRVIWDAIKDESGKTTLQLSLSHMWSDASNRVGFGAKYSPFDDLDLYGGMYYANEHPNVKKPQTNTGGYALADYKVWSMEGNKLDLRIHGMFEKTNGAINYNGYTAGASLILPEGGTYGRFSGSSITADFTHSETVINNGGTVSDNIPTIRFRVFF
jgi:hypothetical protein